MMNVDELDDFLGEEYPEDFDDGAFDEAMAALEEEEGEADEEAQ